MIDQNRLYPACFINRLGRDSPFSKTEYCLFWILGPGKLHRLLNSNLYHTIHIFTGYIRYPEQSHHQGCQVNIISCPVKERLLCTFKAAKIWLKTKIVSDICINPGWRMVETLGQGNDLRSELNLRGLA